MRKRIILTAVLAAATVACSAAALMVTAASAGAAVIPTVQPTQIPVLDWHELNNGCASTVPVCNASDPESVSTAQLSAELAYLQAQGYKTISPQQYLEWVEGERESPALPAKPVLLVVDNGIENFLAGAQPVLASYGDTAAVAVVTGFADGASNVCPEPTYEPGCPVDNVEWDATWAQLHALSSSVYSFIIEAGTAGHFVQDYDPNCTAFYACTVPGESAAAYESRVETDLAKGQSEIESKLGFNRFTSGLWVVPYSDDGYTACSGNSCTPQPSDGPAGWLTSWTAKNFPVAFVEDSFRNGVQNERFRIDVQGWMTAAEFEGMFNADVAAGYFTRAHTPLPAPTSAVSDSSGGTAVAPGTAVTFTDTVLGTSPAGEPTGTVSWSVAGTAGITACTTSTTTLNASGQATCTVETANAGTVTATVSYAGDENYVAATSMTDTVTVS
jgi:Bacterial Ig-like domain (group 3)